MGAVPKLGGDGGVIVLDANGNIATPSNAEGMYRGWVDRSGKIHAEIFKDK
jgi:beta-aspartyl-peptidase (threonine type)